MVKKTIVFDGKTYESHAELVREKGVEGLTVDTFQQRLRKGSCSVQRALTHPCRGTLKTEADYHEFAESIGWKWTGKTLPEGTETPTEWLCGNGHEQNKSFKVVRDNGDQCRQCDDERRNDPNYVNPRKNTESDYHHLAKEKGWKWLGKSVPKDNKQETSWECDQGHPISKSYVGVAGSGCPTCYGDHKTAKGKRLGIKPPLEESLAVTHPKLAKEWHQAENGQLEPEDVYAGWSDVAWWHCPKSKLPEHPHDYDMPIRDRAITGYNCPFCSGSRVAPDTCLAYLFPDIAAEWHRTKNGNLKPEDVTASFSQKVHWFCPVHPDKKWYVSPAQRTGRYRGCPHCKKRTSQIEIRIYTELKTIFEDAEWGPKVAKQEVDILLPSHTIGIEYDSKYYHTRRDKEDQRKKEFIEKHGYTLLRLREKGLPLIGKYDIEVPISGSHRKVIWLLLSRLSDLVSIEEQEKIQSYLSREEFANDEEYREKMARLRFSPAGDSFADKHPEIAKYWDYEKSFPRTPDMFSSGSEKDVWWKCAHKDYHPSFELNIKRRVNAKHYRCEYCRGIKVHERDSLAALYPDLLKDWDYEKNERSPKKIWPKWGAHHLRAFWICSECGYEWRSAPYNRCVQGSICPRWRLHG